MTSALPLAPVWTGAQVRAAEMPLLEAGHGPALMRRASWGLAAVVLKLLRAGSGAAARGAWDPGAQVSGARVYGARVTGLIGSGNNGGDGLWALTFLRRRGVDASAVLTRGRAHQEALQAFCDAGGRVVEEIPAQTELIIDAVLGTGFHGEFDAPQIPEGTAVVACDLPSGVDADTGEVRGSAIPADHTVTFGGLKLGLLTGDGGHLSGRIHAVDIGLREHLPTPRAQLLPEDWDPASSWTPPRSADHKYSRGAVHILAGSPQYPGAAQLTVGAALNTGVGMLTLEAPEEVRRQVLMEAPEVVGAPDYGPDGINERLKKCRAVVVGPGLGEDPAQLESASDAIRWAVHQRRPCVVDASALALVPEITLCEQVLLTPHLGEARRMAHGLGLREVEPLLSTDPAAAAEALAESAGATVLLKGATTVIAAPGGETLLHRAQTPGLATAGSGDVLSGVLGAVLATQQDELAVAEGAALAVRLHAQAAERLDPAGHGGFGASALVVGLLSGPCRGHSTDPAGAS
ncbi:NAD(P)H-hydrate dehydratase [Nesterenkonia cremea]|uniref:ADP-dependent (S)-NAD(P)H-hydrate dehydratase n=1 Tax=Nesterenkonia cremea TaxID=1882340 RepID=A0A917ARZ9_9MICC|nr:NAD(P)H-hydrate dehydratase [Nesterenkonia cremea]GGE70034.1 bifunctional NAD(P)H-hydrate repair enzyme [Nesterenkonia cremea]